MAGYRFSFTFHLLLNFALCINPRSLHILRQKGLSSIMLYNWFRRRQGQILHSMPDILTIYKVFLGPSMQMPVWYTPIIASMVPQHSHNHVLPNPFQFIACPVIKSYIFWDLKECPRLNHRHSILNVESKHHNGQIDTYQKTDNICNTLQSATHKISCSRKQIPSINHMSW